MNEDRYSRIEDYLDGLMNADERAAFEADVRDDITLAEALATAREARERLLRHWADKAADIPLRQTLQSVEKGYFKSGSGGRSFSLPRLAGVAAAALALLAVAWFFLRPPAHERLYARYRAFPQADFTTKSSGGGDLQAAAAAAAFNRGDYTHALALLQPWLTDYPDDLEIRFFTALCLLETRQYAEADAALAAIGRTDNAWADEARWYLALSALRQGKRDACRILLQQIPRENAHFPEARRLLEVL